LVVDDDATACELMASTLRGLGFETVCVADGREALDRLPALRPDAVILDLLLPSLNGFEFLHALRQQPRPHPPVFVWTSLDLDADNLQRLAQSAQAVVNKGQGGLEVLVEELRVWRNRRQPPGLTACAPTAPTTPSTPSTPSSQEEAA
jgi:CheY-like chemotaxis protein